MTVRLAGPDDEDELYELIMALDRDNNSFGIVPDETRIREYIQQGTQRAGGYHGVIDAPGGTATLEPKGQRIIGSIGVVFDRYWCAKNYNLQILWFFVRLEWRGNQYEEELMNWARAYRDKLREVAPIELIDSPFSRVRLPAKIRWWRKHGEQIGGIFIIR